MLYITVSLHTDEGRAVSELYDNPRFCIVADILPIVSGMLVNRLPSKSSCVMAVSTPMLAGTTVRPVLLQYKYFSAVSERIDGGMLGRGFQSAYILVSFVSLAIVAGRTDSALS